MGESLENGNVVPIYMAAKKPWGGEICFHNGGNSPTNVLMQI